jgi:hypothetical protein
MLQIKVLVQADEKKADDSGIKLFPTMQFYKTCTDFESKNQYFPSNTQIPPWNSNGLVGFHIQEINAALRAICTVSIPDGS